MDVDMIFARIFPHIIMILAMASWSSSFIGFKIALSVYNPFEVLAGRLIVASIFCIPVAKELWKALKNKKIRWYIILGVLSEPCLYFLFETSALFYTSASQAGMVLAFAPLCVGIGAWVFLREKLPLQAWFGFMIAIIGIVWLSLAGEPSATAPNPFLGNMLEFGAVLCAVGFTLCARHVVNFVRPIVYTAAMAFGGALFYIPLVFLPVTIEPIVLDVVVPSWMPLVAIVYLGLVVSLIGNGLYSYGLTHLSAGEGGAYMNLIPLLTLAMGVLWLDEYLSLVQYMAAALVIIGILLSQTAKRRKGNDG